MNTFHFLSCRDIKMKNMMSYFRIRDDVINFFTASLTAPFHDNNKHACLLFMFLKFSFVCQNIFACVKLNRPLFIIVYYYIATSAVIFVPLCLQSKWLSSIDIIHVELI